MDQRAESLRQAVTAGDSGAAALTVGSVLRGTILNYVILLAAESADRGNDQ